MTAPSAAQARLVVGIAAAVVLLHAAHLGVLTATGAPAPRAGVLASAAVWLVLLVWFLVRRERLLPAEIAVAFTSGAAALTLDATLTRSPAHLVLIAVSLTGIAMGLVGWTPRGTAAVAIPAVVACQVALVPLVLGPSLLTWYVAGSIAGLTALVCVLFRAMKRRLLEALAEVEAVAQHDPLTGLLNRRGLQEGLTRVLTACTGRQRLAVVLVDVDRFKAVNDVHGHDVGDQVLQAVAAVLRSVSREGDLAVRLGGEELAWVGAWDDEREVLTAAERLRAAVAATPTATGAPVTVSAGVAFATAQTQAAPPAEALSRLLVRADRALYAAKDAGRDRVELADAGLPQRTAAAPAPQQRDGGRKGPSAAGAAGGGPGQRA